MERMLSCSGVRGNGCAEIQGCDCRNWGYKGSEDGDINKYRVVICCEDRSTRLRDQIQSTNSGPWEPPATRNRFSRNICSRGKDVSSFRLLIALAAKLSLDIYGGDINTAYLNASLSIKEYLRSISGYPCKTNGNVYIVQKALYGILQSGHEWNSEINQWFLYHGYERSRTEPCLYYWFYKNTLDRSWSTLMAYWSRPTMRTTRWA